MSASWNANCAGVCEQASNQIIISPHTSTDTEREWNKRTFNSTSIAKNTNPVAYRQNRYIIIPFLFLVDDDALLRTDARRHSALCTASATGDKGPQQLRRSSRVADTRSKVR
jgi:hypothetical protein